MVVRGGKISPAARKWSEVEKFRLRRGSGKISPAARMCSAVEKIRRRGVEVVRSGKKSPAAWKSFGSGKISPAERKWSEVEIFHLRRGYGQRGKISPAARRRSGQKLS